MIVRPLRLFLILIFLSALGFRFAKADDQAALSRGEVAPFLKTHCLDCHGAVQPEAKLDLTSLATGPTSAA